MSAQGSRTSDKPTNAEIRAAGEQHVLDELQRRGVHHRVEPAGRRNDIQVGSGDDLLTLQVRVTSKGQRRGWLVDQDLEDTHTHRLVYAFVDTKPAVPETFIIPAAVVSDVLEASHQAWLATPGHKGQAHTDSAMRMIRWDYGLPVPGYPAGWLETYRERWDLLRSGTSDIEP